MKRLIIIISAVVVVVNKLIISPVVGFVQTVFCYALYYCFIEVIPIPMKSYIDWGIGLWYWWYYQIIIATIAVFLFLMVKKRIVQIVVLCSQMLLFAFYWYRTFSVYPNRVALLFCITSCGAIIGFLLCNTFIFPYFCRNLKHEDYNSKIETK